MKPIRGITTKRVNGLLTIKTGVGAVTIEDVKLPLYTPVLIYYDYTRNRIRDVTTEIPHPDTEDNNLLDTDEDIEEISSDVYIDEEPNPLHHDPDIEEIPEASEDWD